MPAAIALAVVALIHVWAFVLESILWTTPTGKRFFGLSTELAEGSKALAMNQGLYNLFLAAGLVWGIVAPAAYRFDIRLFFLSCVIIAGVFGAITAKRSILFVQGVPGLIALALVIITR